MVRAPPPSGPRPGRAPTRSCKLPRERLGDFGPGASLSALQRLGDRAEAAGAELGTRAPPHT
jgi:hypothetical protein